MKLYTATIESNRSKPGQLLAEGTAADIAEFVNSTADECEIGECRPEDIGERFENPPDDWKPDRRYYVNTADTGSCGFDTLTDAVREYARIDETVIIVEE